MTLKEATEALARLAGDKSSVCIEASCWKYGDGHERREGAVTLSVWVDCEHISNEHISDKGEFLVRGAKSIDEAFHRARAKLMGDKDSLPGDITQADLS